MNFFELGIAEDQNAAYYQVAQHNIQTSIKNEKGTLAMIALQSQDDPQMGYMLELYADEAAYQAHRQTPHFQAYLKDTAAMLESKDYRTVQPLYLGNQGGVSWTAR
ncbi:putative quinol monooxygenase [Avibacterium avium]|uniref:Autoinducer 2-degrading protein lsrG n=2 Tax=Avibacterium avium TaxID=751 RepID=A0A379APY0_AVIAV|nr:antibiotic biosynthesis monooxygenase [Avibacterium avium]SUB23756.1 Autoinducer 2-degrading protein lsrG [Avibacterium avium]